MFEGVQERIIKDMGGEIYAVKCGLCNGTGKKDRGPGRVMGVCIWCEGSGMIYVYTEGGEIAVHPGCKGDGCYDCSYSGLISIGGKLGRTTTGYLTDTVKRRSEEIEKAAIKERIRLEIREKQIRQEVEREMGYKPSPETFRTINSPESDDDWP